MGFWHTGYFEFHEPVGLGDSSNFTPQPVRYACEHCKQDFAELEVLRRHRFEAHPQRQPVLLLHGRPVGRLPVQLMTPLTASDVVVHDATNCRLNGEPLALDSLGLRLMAMRREYVELEISGGGLTTRCVLDFRVADEVQVAGVEAAFSRMAQEKILSLEAISRFNRECRGLTGADLYYDGICQYLYGVMAKERAPDSGLLYEQYIQRYLRASEVLAGFERPLARSIRALVAFHFNQFREAELLASEGLLRRVAGAFVRLLQGLPWHDEKASSSGVGSTVEDLLTDQETLHVLDDLSFSMAHMKDHAEEMLARARRASSGYDRLKCQLLAGEAFASRNDEVARAEARRLARELVGVETTSAWAKALLERAIEP